MAPEAIVHRQFSPMSDVFSFGILAWEIWSLGADPYGEQSVLDAIKFVLEGGRLAQPPDCPAELYGEYVLMQAVFNHLTVVACADTT